MQEKKEEIKGMKEYEYFVEKFSHGIKKELGEEVEVNRDSIRKINGGLDALVVKYPEAVIAPTIYLEVQYQKYQDGYSIAELSKEASKNIKEAYRNIPKVPDFTRDQAEKRLYSVLINENENREMLKHVPHEILGDMAIIPKFKIDEETSFIVPDAMRAKIQMTEEEIMEAAKRNTDRMEYECTNMNEVMRGIMMRQGISEDYIEDFLTMKGVDDPMYVLTNKGKYEGSAAMISPTAMEVSYKKIKEKYPEMKGMYVIPSSRHELILLADTEVQDIKELEQIHTEVQKKEVDKTERLSKKIYRYDGRTKKITMMEDRKKSNHDEKEIVKQCGRGRSC